MHTQHGSALLMASFAPGRSRVYRLLARSEQNVLDMASGDAQSVRTADQLSMARASVAMLDKLWTQIDVLDDVRAMADEVKERGSFFTGEFSERVRDVRGAQLRLAEVLDRHNALSDRQRATAQAQGLEHLQRAAEMDEAQIARDRAAKQQRMHDFFYSSQRKEDASTQQRKQEFDELNAHIQEVREHLQDVGERMKQFDSVTKHLW